MPVSFFRHQSTGCRLLALIILLLLLAADNVAAATLQLGVFAYRPKEVMAKRLQPLADYLSEHLGDSRVELQVLKHDEMEAALAAARLDLLFTNPTHYTILRSRNLFSGALATLINLESGTPTTHLGGVIFTRADNRAVNSLSDLKGSSLAVPGYSFLGGYQTQAFELMQAGIRPQTDMRIRVAGSHDEVVAAVLSGQAEAGFIRTGIIEEMSVEGILDPAELRVLAPQRHPGFPFQASTRLYPEWPFVALPHVQQDQLRKIVAALMLLDADHPVAQAGGFGGFAPPLDYLPVKELALTLRLPPFDAPPVFTLRDAWARWQWQSTLLLTSIFFGLVIILLLAIARQRLARQRGFILSLLNSLGEGVYGADLKGRCTFINPVALQWLGYREEEALGRDQHQLFHHRYPDGEAYPHEKCPIHLTGRDGRERRLEEWFWRKDGQGFPVDLVVTPIRERGRISGAIVAFQDITLRKRAENELARSNAELEQFAYAVSHDLRQPLRMISSYLQLLERSLGEGLDEEQREFMKRAAGAARRLDRMIRSLLDYSRVGRKTEPKAPLAARKSLDEALTFLQPEIEESRAQIEIDGPWPELTASRDELTRLFQNLIGNAIKYVEPGRRPVITINSRIEGDQWRVEVRDNGIGIDPAQHDRLFKVFSRLHGRDQYEGNGVGLALCRKIVENHRGRIEVDSAGAGLGTTFSFTLPLNGNSMSTLQVVDHGEKS